MWLPSILITAMSLIMPSAASGPGFEETITVTATLYPAEIDRTGSATTILNSEEIRESEAFSLGELLGQQAGLTLLQSGTPGKIMSLFSRGTESDHTLLLLNGVALNSPYFAGFNWSKLPLAGLSRIEIVRGPYSTLYGSDAVGGVVQLFTQPRKGWEGRIGAGEYGYQDVGATVSTDKMLFHASTHREDGAIENDDLTQEQALVHLQGKNIELFYRYGLQEVGIPYSEGKLTPSRRMESEDHTVAVPLHYALGESTLLEAQLAYSTEDLHFQDPDDPWGFTRSDTQTERTVLKTHISHISGPWTLTGGAESRYESVDDSSSYGINLEGEDVQNEALFMFAKRDSRSSSFSAGLRVDHHSNFGTSVNPRASLSLFKDHHTFQASVGTSFRAPSVGELYFPFSGNQQLNPEEGISYDLGYIFTLPASRLELHLFHTRLEDLIDFDYATYTFQNLGRSRISGLEGSWDLNLGRAADLHATLTLMKHENRETGEELLRRPEVKANLSLRLKPFKSFQTRINVIYMGERDDVNPISFTRENNPAFTRVDLILNYGFGWGTPFIKIENILDREYEEISGYPALGRRLVAGIRVGNGPLFHGK